MGSLALIDSVNYDDKENVTITGHDFNMNIVKISLSNTTINITKDITDVNNYLEASKEKAINGWNNYMKEKK